MKKIVVLSLLALTFQITKAQDFKKLEIITALPGKLEDAKTELDKIMADPKAQVKPDGYLWKAKIYSSMNADAKLQAKYPDAFKIADEAFTKYVELDPSLKLLKEKNQAEAATNLYSSAYKDGVRTFNNKVWDSAAVYFNYAVKYSDILFSNKLLKSDAPFDTTAILYAGYSAQNAQKVDDAVKFYTRLINANVKDAGFTELYKYVLLQYIKKNNKAEFDKYLAISKKAFPKEEWDDYEAEFINKNFSLADKVAAYEKEVAAGTLTAAKYSQYADVFVNIPKEDKDKMDSLTLIGYQFKALDAYKKACELDPNDGIAHFNAGIIYYNLYGVYEDRVAENKRALRDFVAAHVVEKDPKKKPAAETKYKEQVDALKKLNTDLEKPMTEMADGGISYIEKSYTILKDKPNLANGKDLTEKEKVERVCLRKSVDILANMYAVKRDKAAGKDPKAYDAYDAKYKLYDSLHK
ncbi:tetratricopeptide repeat protein [Parasediminibacterium paludis]|uniref:Tetratricopeptide repeat protein n=1 Tax=Parasediminibacterium paludis TaxID=908966 RepID=A0ABV8PVZ4_9BACT